MNNIVELNGLQGVKSEKVYAYFSTEPKEVQNALELGIACTGADDNGAYNIYFDDEENILTVIIIFKAKIINQRKEKK